jgi:hypothetical protein
MKRLALGILAVISLLGLVAIVVFAFYAAPICACSPSSQWLEPEVLDVSNPGGETYRMTVNMSSRFDTAFHGVKLYGYTLAGDRVCSASYGNVSNTSKSRTMACSAFPSLLVPDAQELARNDFDQDPPLGSVKHQVKLYHGYNGTHRFKQFTKRRARDDRESIGRSLPPNERVLFAAKCTQWARGGNLSAIGDKPWHDWERRPPKTNTRYYLVAYEDTTNRRTDDYVYPPANVSERTASRLKRLSANNDDGTYDLNESEFLNEVSALADTTVSNRSAISDVADRINGDVSHYDKASIDCWRTPPQYDGETGYSVGVYARYDDHVWLLKLTGETELSGLARERDATETPSVTATTTPTPTNSPAYT